MADQKISELTALTGANLADVDAFAVVDTSAVQTKKITYGELKAALDTGTGFVRITGDTMTGALVVNSTVTSTGLIGNATNFDIKQNTSDGSDSKRTRIGGGGDVVSSRGAMIEMSGNEHGNGGMLFLHAGHGGSYSQIRSYTAGVERSRIASNGDISFYNDSAAQGLFWDSSTSRLGLGVTAPSSPLTVNATSSSEGIRVQRNGVSSQYISIHEATGGDHVIEGYGDKAMNIGNTNAQPLTLKTNNQTRLTIDGSGNSTFAGTVIAPTLQTTAGGTVTTASGNDLNIVYPSNRSLFFKEGSTTTLTLDNAQNATFAGAVDISGGRIALTGQSSGTEVNSSIRAHTNNYTYMFGGSSGLSIANNTGEDTRIKLNDGNTMQMYTSATERLNIASNGDISFYNDSAAQGLYWDSSTSRLGLGTTAPLSALNVKGTQGNWRVDPDSVSNEIQILSTTVANDGFRNLRLRSDSIFLETGGTQRLEIDSAGAATFSGTALNLDGGGSNPLLTLKNSATYYSTVSHDTFNVQNNGLKLSTQGTERLRIDLSGRVGIGTTSPSFESGTGTGLEIRNASGNGAHVKLTDNASGAGGSNGFDLYAFNTSGYIENYEAGSLVFRNNGSERMRIDSSGKIQIGNNLPMWSGSYGGGLFLKGNNATSDRYAQLTIVDSTGNATTSGLKINNDGSATFGGTVTATTNLVVDGTTGGSSNIRFYDGGAESWIFYQDNSTNNLAFRRNSSDRVTLDASGNLGIGVVPTHKLDVKGTVGFEATNSTNKWLAYTYTDNTFRLNYNGAGADELVVDSSGRLGIGTSSLAAGIHLTKSISSNYLRMDDGGNCLINFSADTNTAIMQVQGTGFSSWKPLEFRANYFVFKPNNTERMRVDSSGRVGLGTTAPVTQLDVVSSGNSRMLIHTDTDGGLAHLMFKTDSQNLDSRMKGAIIFKRDDPGTRGTGSLHFCVNGVNSDVNAGIADTQMSISSAGNVGLGIDGVAGVKLYVNVGGNNHASIFRGNNAGYAPIVFDNTASSGTRFLASFRVNNSEKGKITTDGSTVTYATSSDYRLKENVSDMTGATARLKQLKPKRFDWIGNAEAGTQDGFLAHEVSSVVPEAITGAKDAVDADGNPEYQGIDQSKLVPLLVKTILELEARITALEA